MSLLPRPPQNSTPASLLFVLMFPIRCLAAFRAKRAARIWKGSSAVPTRNAVQAFVRPLAASRMARLDSRWSGSATTTSICMSSLLWKLRSVQAILRTPTLVDSGNPAGLRLLDQERKTSTLASRHREEPTLTLLLRRKVVRRWTRGP